MNVKFCRICLIEFVDPLVIGDWISLVHDDDFQKLVFVFGIVDTKFFIVGLRMQNFFIFSAAVTSYWAIIVDQPIEHLVRILDELQFVRLCVKDVKATWIIQVRKCHFVRRTKILNVAVTVWMMEVPGEDLFEMLEDSPVQAVLTYLCRAHVVSGDL